MRQSKEKQRTLNAAFFGGKRRPIVRVCLANSFYSHHIHPPRAIADSVRYLAQFFLTVLITILHYQSLQSSRDKFGSEQRATFDLFAVFALKIKAPFIIPDDFGGEPFHSCTS